MGRSICHTLGVNRTPAENVFIGMASSVLVCGVLYKVNLDSQTKYYFLSILFGVLLLKFFHLRVKNATKESQKSELKLVVLLMVAVVCYNSVYSGDMSANTIKQRIGPDLLGWVASAQYVESNFSEKPLDNWLDKSFPDRDTLNPFDKEQFRTKNSIYFTDEFTKQLQSEFLVGASRIGLTSWFGVWLKLLPDAISWKHIYLALSSIFQMLLVLFISERISRKRKKPLLSAILLTSSFAVLFPVFEGGFGQQFSIVAFLYLLLNLQNLKLLETSIIAGSLFLTYLDFFFFTVPLLIAGASAFQGSKFTYSLKVISLRKKILFLTGVISIALLLNPIKRLNTLSFGGWSEGYSPSVVDAFGVGGFYTWTGPGEMRGMYSLLTFIFSIMLLVFLFKRNANSVTWKINLFVLSLFYILLFALAWYFNNDYVLWKSLPFFSVYLAYCLLISDIDFTSAKMKSKLNLLIATQALCAMIFVVSWQASSTTITAFNLPKSKFESLASIINSYSLDFRGIPYVNTYALIGELSWGSDSRQLKNQPAKVSTRKKLIVIPAAICKSAEDRQLIVYEDDSVCIVNYVS